MSEEGEQAGGVATGDQPSEDELRAAYEAELNRISSADMILQTAVSLINIGGRRLGLTAPGGASGDSSPAMPERDLEQVRDAIDGARALLPILERRMQSRELGPLRDAVAQLQMAYAREAQGASGARPNGPAQPSAEQAKPTDKQKGSVDDESAETPGPAQASGRLWVPGH
jgi:hypothetical protein